MKSLLGRMYSQSMACGMVVLLVYMMPYAAFTHIVSASEADSHLSPEMQKNIAAQPSEAAKHQVRDYGCKDWWQEKFPDVDVEMLDRLVRYHELLEARGRLVAKRREDVQVIRQARATSGRGANHLSPTAQAYRQAVFAVEQALDSHPELQGFEEQLAALQDERRAIAAGQAEILDAWRATRLEQNAMYNEAVRLAMQAYTEAVDGLREQAGVGPREALPEGFEADLQAIAEKRKAALGFAREQMRHVKDPETIAQARIEDGSQASFDAANEQYQEIEAVQKKIRAEKDAARQRLRSSDPRIAQLVAAMDEASKAHITAVGTRKDVQQARASVAEFDEKRAALEHEVRVLRRDILAQHPDTYPILDEIAALYGLDRMPATFWQLQD